MFPYDETGGMLHLSPSAAERVAFLAMDTGALGEPLAGAGRDPRLFPAERVRLLDEGWVRAFTVRSVGSERVVADVLFAPGEVVAIHSEWAESEGPGGAAASAIPIDHRRQRHEESWRT
jgi:hypothetical protein